VDDRSKRLRARAIEQGLHVPPVDTQQFIAWLNERTADAPAGRYLTEVWRERGDLKALLPGVHFDREQRDRLLMWASANLAREYPVPLELVPDAPPGVEVLLPSPIVDPPPPLDPGITLVGHLRASIGLGSAGRRLLDVCRLAGEQVEPISYDEIDCPHDHPFETGPAVAVCPNADPLLVPRPDLDVAMFSVNGAETRQVAGAIGPRALHGRYKIGLWFWELEHFPDEMADGFGFVDEVWVTSEFVRNSVLTKAPSGLPVHVIPLGADYPHDPESMGRSITRRQLGLPEDAVLIGCTFDYSSRIQRKNPLGSIDAFKNAFPVPCLGPGRPVLVVKTLNSARFPDEGAVVRAATGNRPDIVVIDDHYTFAQQRAFVRELDLVLSLHRSEGYGYILLEALGLATPVIATGYSGNLAFMNDSNSWLVPFSMVSVGEGHGQYPAHAHWAEPDVEAAASMLRFVVENRLSPAVACKTIHAAVELAPLIDGRAGAAFVRQRLAAIRADRQGC
jgi:glycosyltransferase involved in cell wall biosynthesis